MWLVQMNNLYLESQAAEAGDDLSQALADWKSADSVSLSVERRDKVFEARAVVKNVSEMRE